MEPGDRSREIEVRVIVAEEFLGAAIGELNARRGYITAIGHRSEGTEVLARLLESEYEDLVAWVAAGTLGRARVERV
jgi:translation elongation factor EF-G